MVDATREKGETEVVQSGTQANDITQGGEEGGAHGERRSEGGVERVESLGPSK